MAHAKSIRIVITMSDGTRHVVSSRRALDLLVELEHMTPPAWDFYGSGERVRRNPQAHKLTMLATWAEKLKRPKKGKAKP